MQRCEGGGGRGVAITVDGGEVLQGFQAVGGSYPDVGVATHWKAAAAMVWTARERVWNVLLYPLKWRCFYKVKNIYIN